MIDLEAQAPTVPLKMLFPPMYKDWFSSMRDVCKGVYLLWVLRANLQVCREDWSTGCNIQLIVCIWAIRGMVENVEILIIIE